jgi:hypothetical protein
VCLVARHLEAAGIPTFCMGSALDILQAGNPPRAAFVDFPLGHTVGAPFEPNQQYQIVRDGFRAFDTIETPGDIRHLDADWPAGDDWKSKAADGDGGDTRAPRDLTPRYQTEEDRQVAEADAGN